MRPIRVALIGLSKSAKTSWASEGHLPYLISDRGKERYHIVGLLNSSFESGQRAIEAYNLPTPIKAYRSPEELAGDADVDLVVCSTRVDTHYDAVKPSVAAGKAVFVEWPLAENAHRAQELADVARQSGSRTIVGLQARVAPSVLKVKEVLGTGRLGKVLSSSVQACTPNGGGHSMSEGLAYFLDKKVGGNPVTIAFGHMIDFVHSILGDYHNFHAHTQIQRPKQSIVMAKTGDELPCTSDVPDLVSVHGTLVGSDTVSKGASLIANFRSGPQFKGTLPFVWTIYCEKGEIRMSSERGPFIQAEAGAHPIPIEVEHFDTGEIEQVDWSWEDWQEALPHRGRSIAKLYDLYAKGKLDASCADFEAAVIRHKELDSILYSTD